jgi:NADPH2:quinone reductase
VCASIVAVRALFFEAFGGPGVLCYGEVATPSLVPGQALVRVRAAGLNFADVYRRRGNYHLHGSPPFILGYEGAGVIEEISPHEGFIPEDLPSLRVGDRVAFADVPRANAEYVAAPLGHLVPIPESIPLETAAAVLLQGLTAHYLVHDSHRLKAGEVALIHAAAGGVGLLLTQIAKHEGATVLALASSAEKAARARVAGADHAWTYDGDWVERARAASPGGRGVDVVYDSIGSTLQDSLSAARIGGHVVFFGMAGGDPAPVNPRRLMDESKTLTGGDLWNVLTSSHERLRRSRELFALVSSGELAVTVSASFPLSRGAQAHELLEGRRAVGKILLVVDDAS